ncbi:globin domain-containing protein [Rhodovulum adriaticum]|uniref:Hemoglobin-like flavoprotein n=1 Tax=Rhodovulum adriaticum TaxID=35804 RepID=A0A4V2SMK3_RHOAD|nr:globin domain-containing protein [Rhodovulum adriaticum]MBK1634810.1 hemin receptor [Rhodovulum adriaticum]TCP27616.1 hemoglobin-like flavoprotein [Rhodovulum adriaticum]
MEDSVTDADRVRRGWAMAAAMPDEAGRAFYAHLFRIDPGTRSLFKTDINLQARKLVDTMTFIVDHLDDLDTLFPAAKDLARRHVAYGVTAQQYASVGAALIATLKQLMGPAFTPEDEAAWTAIYGTLSNHMIASAYGA